MLRLLKSEVEIVDIPQDRRLGLSGIDTCSGFLVNELNKYFREIPSISRDPCGNYHTREFDVPSISGCRVYVTTSRDYELSVNETLLRNRDTFIPESVRTRIEYLEGSPEEDLIQLRTLISSGIKSIT